MVYQIEKMMQKAIMLAKMMASRRFLNPIFCTRLLTTGNRDVAP
jgi:hypothetical protein